MTPHEPSAPPLEAIDHLHVHVRHRDAAEAWYARVLGLNRVPELAHWAEEGGPLTLADGSHTLHLALFERPGRASGSGTVALRVTAGGFAAWQAHLARELGKEPTPVDHGESVSIYFQDPDGNPFEITHYEVAHNARALSDLLTDELARAVEHGATPDGGAMSTHLPMALHALAALGASPLRLRAWAARHVAAVPAAPAWPALAQREAEVLDALQRDGAEAVLAQRLPALLPHAGAVGFHVLIRAAHAWESGHSAQLARALAYWSLREFPVPGVEVPRAPRLDLHAWTSALLALPRAGQEAPWIALRMRDAAARPDVQAVAARLQLEGDASAQLRALGRWAAQAYAGSGNFTLLHALTATRALTRLWPLLPPAHQGRVLPTFTTALAAALVGSRWTGRVRTDRPPLADADWTTLCRAAVAHDDEHAIKAVHAAWDLGQRVHDDPDPVWRLAAARALDSLG